MIKTLKLKEKIDREIETLDEEQLREVANFISFLKFSSRLNHQTHLNLERVANLYKEFAEEDRKLAEAGMDDYAELLQAEDLQ